MDVCRFVLVYYNVIALSFLESMTGFKHAIEYVTLLDFRILHIVFCYSSYKRHFRFYRFCVRVEAELSNLTPRIIDVWNRIKHMVSSVMCSCFQVKYILFHPFYYYITMEKKLYCLLNAVNVQFHLENISLMFKLYVIV